MKTEKRILLAFLLNFLFAVFEFIGGAVTGSITLTSDAVHDLGDAASIGISYYFERKSKRKPDGRYTYGYARFSVLGSALTTAILLCGAVLLIHNAILRILAPRPIDYNALIGFAAVGMAVNLVAVLVTRRGASLNQRAVSLHLLEDLLGWGAVLVGATVMRFVDFPILDPLMSIGIAVLILVSSLRGLREILDLFLEKVPEGITVGAVCERVVAVPDVLDVHHIHLWSMDGERNYATMHVVTDADPHVIKERVRDALAELGISHATLELEREGEECHGALREIPPRHRVGHHHRHHH